MGNASKAPTELRDLKPEKPAAGRLAVVDALRGGAVLVMIFYHFGFDLNFLGWIHYQINHDLRWLIARSLILGTFLFTVGVSLALVENQRKNLRHRLARVGRIAAAAGLVTAGSWIFFPNTAIYFGTLHAIALMSLILLFGPMPAYLAGILGIAAIGLGNSYANAIFDHPALAWLGLMTHKPQTEDYVPLLPWFGVCLIGYAAAKALVQLRLISALAEIRRLPGTLIWMGRHSLVIYLVHQPLILGILVPVTRLLRSA